MYLGKKITIVFTITALIAIFGGMGLAWADDSPAPVMKLSATEYNAGDVPRGGVIFHQFELQNQGQAPLLIEKVVAGCGCTSVDWDKEIASGETGYITMTVEVEPEVENGPLSERILVKTNDPNYKIFSLYINAQVVE
jgi:hypothetical protein